VAAVLLAVAVAVASHKTSLDRRISEGFAALDTASGTDDYLEAASTYAGLLPGELAAYQAGRSFLEAHKYERAKSQFQLFLKDYPRSRLAGAARLGLAYADEGRKKWLDAEKLFVEAAKAVTGAENIAEAYLGAGRCAEAGGRLAQAVKWYEAAVAAGAEGYFRQAALDALKEIKLRRKATAGQARTTASAAKAGGKKTPAVAAPKK